jgi:hypothetical protein
MCPHRVGSDSTVRPAISSVRVHDALSAIAALVVIVGLASCAGSQVSAAPSSGVSAGASAGGCVVDALQVCQAIRELPVVEAGTGIIADARRREQNSPRTVWETAHYDVPNGHTLEVQCLINTVHNTVVNASFLKGPTLNDTDISFLRSYGLCKE